MKRILLLIVFLAATGFAQQSKSNPRLSLSPLDKTQCTYAVSVINHVTKIVQGGPRAAGPFEQAPQGLDEYVNEQIESLLQAIVDWGGAKLEEATNHDANAVPRANLRIALLQHGFAYVLELRGCAIDADSIHFSPSR